NEQIVYDVIRTSSGAPEEQIIDACAEKLPKPDGRDTRRATVRRSIVALERKGRVRLENGHIYATDDVASSFTDLIGPTE
ncbi:MAG: hypothetical protein ACWGPN_15780, partial [Gammaproteobacteria bacterium]